MPEMNNETLLALWLDGQLSEAQRSEFEKRCTEDDEFAAQVEAANLMMMEADNYAEQSAPQWDREKTFVAQQRAPWWQLSWLPAASFATSMLAIVMVVTGMQVNLDEGALTIAFGQQTNQKQVEALVNTRLNEFQQNQQSALTNYAQALQQQQTETGAELTKYLLSSSRQERKEDFAELIKFINQQRSDDQLFYARQLNKLQQNIYDNTDPATWSPEPVNDQIND